ncbi:MAG: hypothetical protein GX139_02210 [Armatimonadetes bacterium]|jgi:hypothetical protein|nr:hypothetical protein [Armatimonadota bacterium]
MFVSSVWRDRLSLLSILAVAAAMRFWGLGWGLPNFLRSYSYHPDEFLVLGAAGSALVTGLPGLYNYPSLFIYLVALAIVSVAAYIPSPSMAEMYLAARVVTAIMGVCAILLTYWAARRYWGNREAIIASIALCIAPLHVQHSHFATVDVPCTVFVAACLGFAAMVFGRGSMRDYLLCGLMAGLAAGTKYNAGLVVLSLIAAHFLGSSQRNAGLRRLLAALGGALAAFVISTPAVILRPGHFFYGLTYELRHASEGHGLVFAGTGSGLIYTFTSSLWYGLGPALAIFFLAASIYAVRTNKKALVILAFAVPYYLLISFSQVRFARYALPLFPAAALLIAWMICDIWTRLSKRWQYGLAGACAVILLGTMLYTLALCRLFVISDPRDRAAEWIFANIPTGSAIGVADVPWFYSPPYSKNTGFGTLPQREKEMRKAPYYLQLTRSGQYRHRHWWVVSDYELDDATRLKRASERMSESDRKEWERLRAAREALEKYYTRRTFRNSLSFCGIYLGSTRSLPHDMRYCAPTIWIYERKK